MQGLDFNWCAAPDSGLASPDAVIFLDILPELAAERGDYGSERYERLDFQKRVHSAYLKMRDERTWHFVDASKSPELVESQIDSIIQSIVKE